MRLGFAIDTKRCIGCHACTTSCKLANNLPNGILWNRVMTDGGEYVDTARGFYPDALRYGHFPLACQHCANPACVRVCPVGATVKDPESGIVLQDADKCIGCRMCIAACPYTGVRSFNWDEPKYYLDFPVGDIEAPKHQKHTVEKCVMCSTRVKGGDEPACVQACVADARFWGDLDDPESEVSRIIVSREYMQLLPEEGTQPSVYYLV